MGVITLAATYHAQVWEYPPQGCCPLTLALILHAIPLTCYTFSPILYITSNFIQPQFHTPSP